MKARKIIPYDQASEQLLELLSKTSEAKDENVKLKKENRDLADERDKIKNTLKSWKGKLAAAEKLISKEVGAEDRIKILNDKILKKEKEISEIESKLAAAKLELEQCQEKTPLDFVIPESYKENLIDCWITKENINYYKYKVFLVLKKNKKTWFGRDKIVEIKVKIGEDHDSTFFFDLANKYGKALKSYLRQTGTSFNWAALADEALMSNENYVKDSFILKVQKEFKGR